MLGATRDLQSGSGYVVPADDRDAEPRDVPGASVVEVDTNHQTIITHADAAEAARQ